MAFYKLNTQETIARDKFSLYVLIISAFSVLGQVSLILTSIGKLPPVVPLFYSRPWGDAMLAPSYFLWIVPVITVLTVVINFSVSVFLIKNEDFLNKTLAAFYLLVALTNAYNLVKIISLVS